MLLIFVTAINFMRMCFLQTRINQFDISVFLWMLLYDVTVFDASQIEFTTYSMCESSRLGSHVHIAHVLEQSVILYPHITSFEEQLLMGHINMVNKM